MAAEAFGIAASVAGIIESIAKACVLVRGIRNAPHEVTQVSNQLEAARAILQSLKRSLDTVHRPQEFFALWDGSAQLVLENVRITISDLHRRLGPPLGKLSRWRRITWPFERMEGLVLLQQLQGYMQMLSLVQNGLIQANFQVVQEAAHHIENTLSESSIFPLSSSASHQDTTGSVDFGSDDISIDHGSIALQDPTIPDDSTTPVGPNQHVGNDLCVNSTSSSDSEAKELQVLATFHNSELWVYQFKWLGTFSEREHLGLGSVIVALEHSTSRVWFIFQPKGMRQHESRWYHPVRADFWIGLPRDKLGTVEEGDLQEDGLGHRFIVRGLSPDLRNTSHRRGTIKFSISSRSVLEDFNQALDREIERLKQEAAREQERQTLEASQKRAREYARRMSVTTWRS